MALAAHLKAKKLDIAIFYDFEFPGLSLHIWTGLGIITVDSVIYSSLPGMDAGVTVAETIDLSSLAGGLRVTGNQPELLAIALGDEAFQNSPAKVWLGVLDANGQFADRECLISGFVTDMPIDQAPGQDAQVEIEITPSIELLQDTFPIFYTKGDQAKIDPTDTFFDFIEAVEGNRTDWPG